MVSTTGFLNAGVYRLFGTPFGIKITPFVRHYTTLSNKWGAVHNASALFHADETVGCSKIDTTEQIFLFFFGKVCYTTSLYNYLY